MSDEFEKLEIQTAEITVTPPEAAGESPPEAAADGGGITIDNDTDYTVAVLITCFWGPSSNGIVLPRSSLSMPAPFPSDVYVLYVYESTVQIVWTTADIMKISSTKKATNLAVPCTIVVSKMA